jgi:hypothetical protein
MVMPVEIRRLLQQFVSAFFLLTIIKRFKSRSSLIKIKAAQGYVLGVKKTRAFFLGVLFVFISFVFLYNALSLIQTALFTYSMWSIKVKFIVALLLGGMEFIMAIGILIYLFREETWGKFSGIQKVVNLVIDEQDKNDECNAQ